VDYAAHLLLMALDGRPWTLHRLLEYAHTAEGVGFQALSANDHLVFPRPWLEGPTALAAVLSRTGRMALATTVALPVVRGPVALAKSLAAIDLLCGGRLVVGVGPGSSAGDYAAVGVPFEERWKRLDEALQALRALWLGDGPTFMGEYYFTEGLTLEPYPAPSVPGPPSGSAAGAQKPALGGWRGWATAGWLPPTTPPRKRSRPLGERSQITFAPSEKIPTGSPMLLLRCSSTSPKSAPPRSGSSGGGRLRGHDRGQE
jgi:alkanesulfonate monooxygenase SsuD/methylene tetrahydromethanopterin reductase-like flavin-dependent oxidoreductase (luciferase family)